jgi:hypothetical protein
LQLILYTVNFQASHAGSIPVTRSAVEVAPDSRERKVRATSFVHL